MNIGISYEFCTDFKEAYICGENSSWFAAFSFNSVYPWNYVVRLIRIFLSETWL
jgi:hypothetical protein